jgi:hypothetical protein
MATKRTSKKRRKKAKGDPLTKGDFAAFKNLGVGEGDLSLRKLIKGQRRINGRLLAANQEIKKVLKALGRRIDRITPVAARKSASLEMGHSLKEITKHLGYVGGDEPPGCEPVKGGH